ncbi:bifunctional phosphatase PAP2/diacylglycerol kinase family protein [Sinomonas mesophila]|uniref:bifunctional phosphatase PAP2/diacylglycerol kinase family protein n=1 Tax=Sinomonas mesophila TaxID=1531955 RepID=UPI001FE4A591|nr:bifunctional phosphatase PAP2/diacylglycerol kinase family protein [Sinomonas mesophila]
MMSEPVRVRRRLRPPGRPPFHAVEGMDRALVRRIASLPRGPWDRALVWLTRAATKSKLWMAVAALLATRKGPPRRAAAHGLLAVAVASAVVNIVFKTILPRARPEPHHLPVHRFLHPQPTSSSLPSGHSASAAAFATGVGIVSPPLGAALAPVAAGVAYSRVHTGAHWPSDVVLGSAMGVGAAFVTRSWWPRQEAPPPRTLTAATAPALDGGRGLAVVVNPLSGEVEQDVLAALRVLFPHALVHELEPDDDVARAARDLAATAGIRALAVWGGDGTVGTVAGVCAEAGLPLAVLPGGTFNHFARDAGALEPAEVAEAVSAGRAVRSDLGRVRAERGAADAPQVQELVMLNTASVGLYPDLVRRRDHYLHRVPILRKRGAAAVAALRTFVGGVPTRLTVDGVPHRLWTLYVGRGRYWPRDLAPLERPLLDDAVLDVRSVNDDGRFARLRLAAALVTGTTASCRVVRMGDREGEAARLDVRADDGALTLAIDGEVLPGVRRAELWVEPGALTVYSPLAPDGE